MPCSTWNLLRMPVMRASLRDADHNISSDFFESSFRLATSLEQGALTQVRRNGMAANLDKLTRQIERQHGLLRACIDEAKRLNEKARQILEKYHRSRGRERD